MGTREDKMKRGIKHLLENMKPKRKLFRKNKGLSCRNCMAMCLRAREANFDKKKDFAGNCDMYIGLTKEHQPVKIDPKVFYDGIEWRKIMMELDNIENELEAFIKEAET